MTIQEALDLCHSLFPVQGVYDTDRKKFDKVPLGRGYTDGNWKQIKPYPIQASKKEIAVEQIKHYQSNGIHAFGFAPLNAGLAVLDVDSEGAYDLVIGTFGDILDGPYVRTPNGGYHFYFKLPKDASDKVKLGRNKLLDGVDYRCAPNFYLMAPGSYFPDNTGEIKPYTVFGDLYESPPMPESVIKFLETNSPKIQEAVPEERLPEFDSERTGFEGLNEDSYYADATMEEVLACVPYLENMKTEDGRKELPLDFYPVWRACGAVLKKYGLSIEHFKRITYPTVPDSYIQKQWRDMDVNKAPNFGTLVYHIRKSYPGFSPRQQVPKVEGEVKTKEEKQTIPEPPPMPQFAEILPLNKQVPVEWFSPNEQIKTDKGIKILECQESFETMLKAYGLFIWWDDMTQQGRVKSGVKGMESQNLGWFDSTVLSIAQRNNYPRGGLEKNTTNLMMKNRRHPVRDYIETLPEWDGIDRVKKLIDTVVIPEHFPKAQKTAYIRKFLMQCMAAIYDKYYRQRGVLTFIGEQGIGKTTWFQKLFDPIDNAYKSGQSFNPENKDDRIEATGHWVTELAEIDGITAKVDMQRLKAFLTQEVDQIRRPYAKSAESIKRRTVFVATSNSRKCLKDETGTTRFWAMWVDSFERYEESIDMLWAQVKAMYDEAVKKEVDCIYWLTGPEDKERAKLNKEYEQTSNWHELIERYYAEPLQGDDTEQKKNGRIAMAAQDIYTQLMNLMGNENPGVCPGRDKREIGIALESLGHKKKRTNGPNKFWLYKVDGDHD